MRHELAALVAEHRAIEAALEHGGDLRAILIEHYRREDPVLQTLCTAATLAKLRAQHDEALEIAARLKESTDAGQTRDADHLNERLAAIVQHNIIEEERDIYRV